MSFDSHRQSPRRTRTILLAREPYCPPGLLSLTSSSYALYCALIACLGSLTYGYDQGLLSVVLVEPQFLSRFYRINGNTHPDSDGASASFWKGLLTASLVLGALVGSLNQGWIADVYSRKYSIVIAVGIFILGSSVQTAAVSYDMLVIARFIGGIGIGMFSMVTPLYISEISSAEVRGSLLVCEEFSIVVGIVIAFWTTYGTYHMDNEWAWRLPFLLQMVPADMVGVGICFLPFSPRWLVSKGRDEEALMTLSKLRQLPTIDQRVQLEWLEIRAEVALHKEISAERHPHLQDGSRKSKIKLELASWGDLFRKGCIKRTHIGIMLFFFQQFVGINALTYYSPTLLKSMSLDFNTTLTMAGVLNTISFSVSVGTFYTMDRFGRRPLLLTGTFFSFTSLLIIAILVGLYSHDWNSHKTQGWTAVAMLLSYMIAFGASWGPVAWTIPAEIFPLSSRAKGLGVSVGSKWVWNCVIGLITPPLVQKTGYGTYIFFATFCVIAVVWMYSCVPETEGKSLEEMDEIFGDKSSIAEQEGRERIERELFTSNETGPQPKMK
ncbi:hypothetical protein CBER1_00118 [Cercospora berteroae]|uniref:Major facilitator superfamily (MFS) profile domain-containing protein n=1 Tax=Cercospora berteroae TaxID=357750 RepID=A0A2S6CDH1_9PEZI|nr:hypothetical protein CBER1_00118 [Cercospora berteroae]